MRMRTVVVIAVAVTAGLALAGCDRNPIDRLLGSDRHTDYTATPPEANPAPAPSPVPTSPPPRFETYRFEGTVRSGGTRYYGSIAPGDPVSGTFRIDFDQPLYASILGNSIYKAFAAIEGTVGAYSFHGEDNFLYVAPNVTHPYRVDTGLLTLDGNRINFDFFFFVGSDGVLTDGALSNLRDLDRRTYTSVQLWFETFPAFGEGFDAAITRLQRET